MSGESEFWCAKCGKKWEGLDFKEFCLDCEKDTASQRIKTMVLDRDKKIEFNKFSLELLVRNYEDDPHYSIMDYNRGFITGPYKSVKEAFKACGESYVSYLKSNYKEIGY